MCDDLAAVKQDSCDTTPLWYKAFYSSGYFLNLIQ